MFVVIYREYRESLLNYLIVNCYMWYFLIIVLKFISNVIIYCLKLKIFHSNHGCLLNSKRNILEVNLCLNQIVEIINSAFV